jgi:hypothetical protein
MVCTTVLSIRLTHPNGFIGRCIEHTVHLMASHFVSALHVPGLAKAKAKIHASAHCKGSMDYDRDPPIDVDSSTESVGGDGESMDDEERVDEFDIEFDVETSMEMEALADDAEAMHAALSTEFDAGDVVGKLLGFIAQIRASSEDTRGYLAQLAMKQGCPVLEIKLWFCTRWGSLSDCFCTVLALQKVRDHNCSSLNL